MSQYETIMQCIKCGSEMELREMTFDYYDPGDPYGHGQYTRKAWVCPDNKCDEEQPYIEKDFTFEE